jgi:hypothetical protein
MTHEYPEEKKLVEFYSNYMIFARRLLQLTRIKQKHSQTNSILRYKIYVDNGNLCTSQYEEIEYTHLLPCPNDTDFPISLATKCARMYFDLGLCKNLRMSDSNGRPIPNTDYSKIELNIVHSLFEPIFHLVKKGGRINFTQSQISAWAPRSTRFAAVIERGVARWRGRGLAVLA